MAKRKGTTMALFEAISKTQAKPGGQVLPPHVGIQSQPAKAPSRAVLYGSHAEGGEMAEPGAAPPPAPANPARGTWVPADKPQASPDRAGSYEPTAGGTVPGASGSAAGRTPASVPVAGGEAAGRPPESSVTPTVVKPAKTSAAPKPSGPGVPMSRAAVSASPATRGEASGRWSKPRLMALVLAAVLVVGAVWYLTVKPGFASKAPTGTGGGSIEAGVGLIGYSEALPLPPLELQSGKWYLVVETTRGGTAEHKKDAEAIADWLTKQDVPAVAKYNGNRWVVIAYQRFDTMPFRDDGNGKTVYDKDAMAFAKKIEELGKKYFSQSRKYQFKQTNAKGEFTPFYVRISG